MDYSDYILLRKEMTQAKKDEILNQALDLIMSSGANVKNLFEKDGLIKQMTKGLVERVLQAKISEHLWYDKYQHTTAENAINGQSLKKLITDNGPLEINVPRDRHGDFEPLLVPKKTTRLTGLNDKVISLYAKEMSISNI